MLQETHSPFEIIHANEWSGDQSRRILTDGSEAHSAGLWVDLILSLQ